METNKDLFAILSDVDKIFHKIATEAIPKIENKTEEIVGASPQIEKKETLSEKVEIVPEERPFEWEHELETQLNKMFSDVKCKIKHFFYISEELSDEEIKNQIIIPHSKTADNLIYNIKTVYAPFFVIETTLECTFKLHMNLYSRIFHIPSTIKKEVVQLTTVDLLPTEILNDEEILLIKNTMLSMRAKLRKVLEKTEALSQKPMKEIKTLIPSNNTHTILYETHFSKILQPKTFELEIDDEITKLLNRIESEQKLIYDDETAEQFKKSIEEIVSQKQKYLHQNLATIQKEFIVLKERGNKLELELKESVDKEPSAKKRLYDEIKEFKARKKYLSKQIQNLKLLKLKLEKWKDIIRGGDIEDLNSLLFSEFKEEILKNMQKIEPLSPAETLELLQKNRQVNTKIKDITIFCINLPLSIISYSTGDKEEKRKLILFHLTNEVVYS